MSQDQIMLTKGMYKLHVIEECEKGNDQWTLWSPDGELIGRWVKPSKTPDGFADEVERVRVTHAERMQRGGVDE